MLGWLIVVNKIIRTTAITVVAVVVALVVAVVVEITTVAVCC